MGRGSADFKDLLKLQKKLEKLEKEQVQAFSEDCIKELAGRLLAKVIKRTPVGKKVYNIKKDSEGRRARYKKGKNAGQYKKAAVKNGGTLRREWTVGNVSKDGSTYRVEVLNPTEYAPYIEYGHRTRNHKGWVEGRFMLTLSEQEIKEDAPRIIEERLKRLLGECFND